LRSLITDAHTALIEYSITEENTYLFVLTASEGSNAAARNKAQLTLKAYPLEIKNGELVSRVRELERQIASRSPEFEQSAKDLYDLLIKPAGDQLVLTTRLVIVPDGVLWQLPFEALLSADDHFLIDQMQISYAPSLTALREMQNRRSPPLKPPSSLLATGKPTLSTEFTNRNEVAYPNIKLTTSTEPSDESKQVATSFGISRSRVIDGSELTKERLRSEAARAQLLHLSGPMLLDNVSPMASFLGVSVSNVNSADCFVEAREIMNWQTTAQLVVISNARYSGSYPGLSAAAMTWSWFVSGTPATMLSRWEVDSPAATQLLSQFYSNIKPTSRAPASQAKALRQSVMTLRHSKEYQHPYYWAAFQLLGDAR
jgi:CHAT domain-containing protein